MFKNPLLIIAADHNRLNTAQISLPSNQQLQRLRIDDQVKLKAYGLFFWCRVTARNRDTFIGRIVDDVANSEHLTLLQDDSIAFGLEHIYQVEPSPIPNLRLPDWLLCTSPAANTYHLLRTKWPALLASADVLPNGFISMRLVRLYDEPDNRPTDIPKLLEGGRRWLQEYHLRP